MPIFLLILMFAAGQVATITPPKRSPLFSSLTVDEYFGELYIDRLLDNGLIFVFFVGEPITVHITIGNRGPSEEAFHFGDGESMFAIQASRDGQPIDLDVSFDAGMWQGPEGRSAPFDRTATTHLKAREAVRWSAKVDTALPPGRYRLSIGPNSARDGNGLPIVPSISTHVFEVRPDSPTAQPEIARREALRHFVRNDPSELAKAEIAVARLLKVHPNSYEAFFMRGRIAEARGDMRLAMASYDRAADILRKDQDALLVKYKSAQEREGLLRSIDAIRTRK